MVDAHEQIHAIEALRARAILDADVTALREITGDDYVHVDGSGRLRNKEEFLASLRGDHAHYTHYSVADNVISIHADVAIVSGRFQNEHVTPDGAKIAKSGRHLRVYVRRLDGWSNIAHQGTEIRQ